MKKVFILVLITLTFASCQLQQKDSFAISGKLENIQAKLIYLERLPYENTQPAIVDSATISPDGKFSLKGRGTEEDIYALKVNNGIALLFVNDNNNIEINLNADDYRHPQIKGSDGTEKLYEFINHFREKDSVLSETYYTIDSLQKNNGSDSMIQVLEKKGTDNLAVLNQEIKNFVASSNSPASICFVLDKAKNSMMPEVLNNLAQSASARFKEHRGLAVIKTMMAEAAASSSNNDNAYPFLNQPAPDLTMNDVNGKPVSISNFKGKYVLVDFWASWCVPCRHENPNVVAAFNKFRNKNFTVLGVSLDADKSAWLDAIKKDHLAWTQMSDLKQWESAAVNTYKFDGIPFNVLIDPQGKIIATSLLGPALEDKLKHVLQ